jgi:uncharacterized membrane protein
MDHKNPRLSSIDALRGLIILLMALDHANYFIAQEHSPGEYWGGPFPSYDTALSFLTRWVTHFCAPGFFLLMGVGMYLFAQSHLKQGWSKKKISGYFLVRGLVLMALQLLVVNRTWELIPGDCGLDIYIGVLFALGGAMITASLFLWLDPKLLLGLTAVLFIGTELQAPDPSLWGQIKFSSPVDYLKVILIYPGGTSQVWSNYPILPWLELVTFGIVLGSWLRQSPQKAARRALYIGLGFLAGFVILRRLDGFGNIRPRASDTWIDFLNVVKYPPAITFTLMTIGVNLIVLWAFSHTKGNLLKFLSPLVVYGQAPLFFYVLHLFLYAGFGHWITPHGTNLPGMYIYWLLGVALLYPLCLWWGKFKRNQPIGSVVRFY